jgi:cephalosporin hydroxylase
MSRAPKLTATATRGLAGIIGRAVAMVEQRRNVPPAYRDRYRIRTARWLLQLHDALVGGQTTWMGVQAQKNPLDAWIYQEILFRVRPEAIVELGSAYGGSTLFLSHMLDLLNLKANVISVDHSHEAFRAVHRRIIKVTGDTRDPNVVERVRTLVGGRNAMVIHDASHEADVVLEDLRNYAPLVGPGNYLIVEDGVRDYLAGRPGPVNAVERFLVESDQFELDPECERFLLTYNPKGFLRRLVSSSPAADPASAVITAGEHAG